MLMRNSVEMTPVIIDNCIVSKNMGIGIGVCVRSIKLEQKINPHLNFNSLRKITCGNKQSRAVLIQQLCDGILKFEDLP